MPTATVLAAYSRNANDLAASPSPTDFYVGRGGDGNGYRSVARWDLAGSMPSGATVTRVRLRSNETDALGDLTAESHRVGPYNGGTGSTNPQVDSEANVYTRCNVAALNYGTFTDYRTTGLKTVELGSPAISDCQSRFDAAGSWALAVQQTPTEGGGAGPIGINWDPFSGGSPPALLIDYVEAAAEDSDETEFEEFDGMDQTEFAIWNRALSRCGDFRLTVESAKVLASATAANPVVCTVTAHGYEAGDLVVITQMDQMTEVNSRVFRVENPATNTFELADENGLTYTAETSGGFVRKLGNSSQKQAKALFDAWPNLRDEVLRDHPWNATMHRDRLARLQAAKTITGATAANPVVITAAAHGYSNGDLVKLDRIAGTVELNDRWFPVTVLTVNTFSVPVDGTSYTAYTSGGRAQKALTPLTPDFDYAYRYDLPSDCLRLIEIANQSREAWEVSGERLVFTDEGITAAIRYQRRVRDTTKYDPLLRSLLAGRLAYEIVEELTQSNTKKELLAADLKMIEGKAKGIDGQEQSTNPLAEDDWVLARL